MPGVSLRKIVENFRLEIIREYGNLDHIEIIVADCTRPGLQLAGFYNHFGPDRLQLLGNMEYSYLQNMDPHARYHCLDVFLARIFPV